MVGLRFTRAFLGGGSAGRVPLYLPALCDNTSSSLSDVVPGSAPSAWAETQAEGLSGSVEAPAILVYSNPKGFSGADLGRVREGIRRLNEGPGRPYRLQRTLPLAAQNSSNPTRVDRGLLGDEVLPVLLYFEPGTRLARIATGVREILESPGPLQISVTSIRPGQYDTKFATEENLSAITAVTTLAIFLVVALTYRLLVAPLIPLTSIGLATFLTLCVLGWIASERGTSVPTQIEPTIVVLLFGVGKDYALFLLSRTRRALEEGTGTPRRRT